MLNYSQIKSNEFFKNKNVYIHKENFAIVKAKKFLPKAFAIIRDKNEITAIIDESKIKKKDILEIEKDWKILSFDMVLPFGLVGFLARILKALGECGVSIFVASSYSTDHILVKKKDLSKAIKAIKSLGFKIKRVNKNTKLPAKVNLKLQ
jgi:hypothetical protein